MITGTVSDPTGAVIPGAKVTVTSGGSSTSISTDESGRYKFENLPLQRFTLSIEAPGFARAEYAGELRSVTPVINNIHFKSVTEAQQITVISEGDGIEFGPSSTYHEFEDDSFEKTPIAAPEQAMSAVVESVPGVVPEENGRIHVRGSEVQPQYVLDGIPIAANVSGTFATALDTENLQSAEVISGNIPAEFGDKVAAIVSLNTKSGLQMPWRGSFSLSAGSFRSQTADLELGGHLRKLGIFATADASRNRRFLDPPEIGNLHNRGGLAHIFSRLDWQGTSRDTLRLSIAADATDFQVPNLEEQAQEGQHQRQELRDDYQALTWTHAFSPSSIMDLSAFRRSSDARLLDPGQTARPFYITQYRRERNEGLRGNLSKEWHNNSLKGGVELYRLPLLERFTLAVTDPKDVGPNEPVSAFSINQPFQFAEKRTGTKVAWFLHDRLRLGTRITADLGLRGDYYDLLIHDTALSPRLGLAYRLERSNTVFRASYNRLFQTPPLENLLLSSSPALAPLSSHDPDDLRRVSAERQNSYEIGVQQRFGAHLRLDISRYIKNIKNTLDDQQLFTTGIIFPVSLVATDVRGTEIRLDLVRLRGLSAFASYANAHATATGPIMGGLLLGDEGNQQQLSPHKFRADQDERNEMQFGVLFTHRSGGWVNFSGRYDSGLPTDFAPADLPTFDPHIQRQLDPVRLRIKPRALFGASIGIELRRDSRFPVGLQVGVNNLTDRFYLYNFHSVFSGTHIGRPRDVVGRIVFRWNGTK